MRRFLLFLVSADRLFKQKKWGEAEKAYTAIAAKSPLSRAGFESASDEHSEDTNYVFCAVPPAPLQGRPFKISVHNERGKLAKGPVKLSWSDPALKVYRDDASQIANGAEFELPNGTMTLHAVPSTNTALFSITAQGSDSESGRTSDKIHGWTNPGIITQTVAQQPHDQTRKTIGIGEEVWLIARGNTTPVAWDAPGEVLSGKTGNSVLLTAPEEPCTLVVTTKFNNKNFQTTFQVIKPTGLRFRFFGGSTFRRISTPPEYKWYAFEYNAYVYVAPDIVNFYKLKFFESASEPFGISGGYTVNVPSHSSNGPHKMDYIVVPGLGTRMDEPENLGGCSPASPFVDSEFHWEIDWSYRVGDNGMTNYFLERVNQTFNLKAFSSERGRFTISKKDTAAWIEGDSSKVHFRDQ